jgi:hypothetical protein
MLCMTSLSPLRYQGLLSLDLARLLDGRVRLVRQVHKFGMARNSPVVDRLLQ